MKGCVVWGRTVVLATALVAGAAAAGGAVSVEGAWIREAPPGLSVLAAYFVARNEGEHPRILAGASSPVFGKVMMHRTIVEGGVARMEHVMKVMIRAGGATEFAPGGYHLMLMKPKRPLRAGDRVPVTLEFADGSSKTVTFEVRKPGG